MKTPEQIEVYIDELGKHSGSLEKLARNQYNLLKQTKAISADFKAFLNDLKGAIAMFINQ